MTPPKHYLARCPNDGGPFAGCYVISEGNPPILRRKRGGHHEWDFGFSIQKPTTYHSTFQGLRLRPGEGPVEIDIVVTRKPYPGEH